MEFGDFSREKITSSLWIVDGNDPFLKEKAVGVFKTLIEEDVFDLNYAEFSGEVSADSLVSAITAFPFMAEKRLVVIRDWGADERKTSRPSVDEKSVNAVMSAISTSPDTVTVFVCELAPVPAAIKKAAQTVVCNKKTKEVLTREIKSEFASQGKTIDTVAASTIVDYCMADSGRIFTETQKLLQCGEDVITLDLVKQLVHRDTEFMVYAMTNAISAGDKAQTLFIIKELYSEHGASALLGVLTNNYRKMLAASLSQLSTTDLASVWKTGVFGVEKLRMAAKKYTQVELKKIVDKLTDLEFSFKSGEMTDENAFWLAVLGVFIQ